LSSKYGVLTLGDAMITLNPEETGPLRFVNRFERKVGGAELNFAIGCSRLGMRARWLSRLGKGVRLGGELEYVDRGTLGHAFGSRTEVGP